MAPDKTKPDFMGPDVDRDTGPPYTFKTKNVELIVVNTSANSVRLLLVPMPTSYHNFTVYERDIFLLITLQNALTTSTS